MRGAEIRTFLDPRIVLGAQINLESMTLSGSWKVVSLRHSGDNWEIEAVCFMGGFEGIMSTTHVVGLSGGKDSTAMALRLAEVEPDTDFQYVCTPTGDELPTMIDHWAHLEQLLVKPIVRVTNRTLAEWIAEWDALPNARMRWVHPPAKNRTDHCIPESPCPGYQLRRPAS